MRGLILIAMIALFGCASSQTPISEAELEEVLKAQDQWLQDFYRGQPLTDIAIAATRNSYYSLEVFHGGQTYQYIHAMYPTTRLLYGLYFEGGELGALLLNQAVTDFFQCEYWYRHREERWLQTGMLPVQVWISQADQLGKGFDSRLAYGETKRRSSPDKVEAIAHLPLALIGLPFYGLYTIAGGPSRGGNAKAQADQKFGLVQVGTTTSDELPELVGRPERRSTWASGEVWVYIHPSAFIGVHDGVVVWKEVGRVETLTNSSTNYRRDACDFIADSQRLQ
jgi:hypothetical protein